MIKVENVTKQFGTGVAGLIDITVHVEKSEFVFLVGQTGSGKTTFFRLLTREMLPTSGSIVVNDWDIVRLPMSKVPHLRKKIGVVFQDLKLLTDRTILENVMLPLEVAGVSREEARKKAEGLLTQVGIMEHSEKFPVQVSGGELQRTAIARALILSPDILLADEPTGNLDEKTSWEIVKILSQINDQGTTVIMATHNNEIVNKLAKRVVRLDKGKLIDDTKHKGRSSSAKATTDKEEHEKEKKEGS